MTTDTRRTASALGSIAGLALLGAGLPTTLFVLGGSPIPTSLPTVSGIIDGFLRQPLSDAAILKGVAIAGWIAWLQIAASIVIEISAWVRGVPANRLSGVGPMQPTIRKLVASSAFLLSSPNFSTVAVAAPAPHTYVIEAAPSVTVAPTLHLVGGPIEHRIEAVADTRLVHVVEPRDTLWGLAETHLSDPFRWRELFDLNHGTPQPDGRALEDPNLIIVGWTLQFPSDATGLPSSVPAPATGPQPAIEQPIETTPTSSSTAPTTAAPTTSAPTTVGPTTTGPPTTSGPVPTTTPTTNSPVPTAPTDPTGDVDDGLRSLAPLFGGGLLAASLVLLIDRLRRSRTRRRQPAAHGSLDENLQRTELSLRHAADLDGVTRLDLALRAIAYGLFESGTTPPVVRAVRLDGETIEVLLDNDDVEPPTGFEPVGDNRCWRLLPDTSTDDLIPLSWGAPAPLPSLVTIGTTGGDPVLVDLETAGILTIASDADDIGPYIRRIATELATSTWTDTLEIVTVGEQLADLTGTHRLRHFPELSEALAHLGSISRATLQALGDAGADSTLAARIASEHGDSWTPTVLISGEPIDTDALEALASEISPGSGVAVVAPGPIPPTGWHAHLNAGIVELAPHGITLDAVTLDPQTSAAIDEILTELTVETPDPTVEPAPVVATVDPGPFEEPEFDIEVRVLGEIDIFGVEPIARRKSMEVAVYLALHPEGVTDDTIKTVFWPDAVPAKGTYNTTISMVRSALGEDADGQLYLPHFASTGNRFRLHPRVQSDLRRFEARVAYAAGAPGERAREVLAEALAMVRGQPFDTGRGYEWAFAEGHVTRAAIAVANAAHHLAQLALEAGDHRQAEWAANKGLLASPGDEALYRDRMLAAHHAGNTNVVKQLMAELCEIVEDSEPYELLSQETVAHFRRLSGSSPRHLD